MVYAQLADHQVWAEAWIETVASADQVIFIPYARSSRTADFCYVIESIKEGPSGRAKTRQSGQVTLQSGQPKALATLTLNLNPDDQCTINIILFDGDKLVAETSYIHPEER